MKEKDKIPIGTKVRISPESKYYRDSPGNPKDTDGIVNKYYETSELNISVKWSNGYTNGYSKEDLIIIENTNPIYEIY